MPNWLSVREADRLTGLQNFVLELDAHVGTASADPVGNYSPVVSVTTVP